MDFTNIASKRCPASFRFFGFDESSPAWVAAPALLAALTALIPDPTLRLVLFMLKSL
jgi:hypothetical protein